MSPFSWLCRCVCVGVKICHSIYRSPSGNLWVPRGVEETEERLLSVYRSMISSNLQMLFSRVELVCLCESTAVAPTLTPTQSSQLLLYPTTTVATDIASHLNSLLSYLNSNLNCVRYRWSSIWYSGCICVSVARNIEECLFSSFPSSFPHPITRFDMIFNNGNNCIQSIWKLMLK